MKDLSQLELAERVGIGNTRLCRIESGALEATAAEVEAIAAAMSLTMGEFYGEGAIEASTPAPNAEVA